jgi:DNA-binding HxlR family transcriptional regulator/putative sterol carrier protein
VKRSYGQHCAIAKALDVVGGRWTLLIVREMVPGPRRFKDLLEGLPGIGTNLLTERLRFLEDEEIIARRTLPPPAGSVVYELTAEGRRLESVLFGLSRWGSARLDRQSSDHFSPRWAMLALRSVHARDAPRGFSETYEFRIGDEVFTVSVDDGDLRIADGPTSHPDVVVTSDPETFFSIGESPEALERALAEGRFRAEGKPEALQHCEALFAPLLSASPVAA